MKILHPKNSKISSLIHGFTLIEMLVVISIIGVLMAIALVAFQSSRASARDAKRQADLEQIRSALELFRADSSNGLYPVGSGNTASVFGAQLSVYLPTNPADPLTQYTYYYTSSTGSAYYLCARLETSSPGAANCPGATSCGSTCNYQTKNP